MSILGGIGGGVVRGGEGRGGGEGESEKEAREKEGWCRSKDWETGQLEFRSRSMDKLRMADHTRYEKSRELTR